MTFTLTTPATTTPSPDPHPPGWDDPCQDGTKILVSDTEAVLADPKGHEARCTTRPGATAFRQLCR
ncbi:hypothetical protein ACQPW3_21460 [Actinosynnema sp. CA-248983]